MVLNSPRLLKIIISRLRTYKLFLQHAVSTPSHLSPRLIRVLNVPVNSFKDHFVFISLYSLRPQAPCVYS